MRRIGLRAHLVLAVALSAAFPILGLGTFLNTCAQSWLEARLDQRLEEAARAWVRPEVQHAADRSDDLFTVPAVALFARFDAAGKLTGRAALEPFGARQEAALSRFGATHDRSALAEWRDRGLEEREVPLVSDGESTSSPPLGSCLFLLDPAVLRRELEGLRRRVWLAGVLITAAVAAMAFWSTRHFTEPLRRLLEGVNRMAAGDLELPIGGRNLKEFGRLTRWFDAMAKEVCAAREVWAERQHALERAVEGRTTILAQANRDLEQQDRLRDEFLSCVSHELRTPLTGIHSSAEILLQYGSEDEAVRHEFTGILDHEVRRLVFRLRNFRDLEAVPESRAARVPVSVSALVNDALEACRPRVNARRLQSSFEGPAVHVLADPSRLRRALEELIYNAAEFSPPDSMVELRSRSNRTQWIFEVGDHGLGIPPRFREAVFQRFRQIGHPLTGKPVGTGLGLSLCQEIVIDHGGTVEIRDREPQGTWMVIALPSAEHSRKTRSAGAVPTPGANS